MEEKEAAATRHASIHGLGTPYYISYAVKSFLCPSEEFIELIRLPISWSVSYCYKSKVSKLLGAECLVRLSSDQDPEPTDHVS